MKLKTSYFVFSLLILVAVIAHGSVQFHGTLRVVFPEINSVIIDQQRYQLAPDTPIYRESNLKIMLPLTVELEGSRVSFAIREFENRDPMIIHLMLLDD